MTLPQGRSSGPSRPPAAPHPLLPCVPEHAARRSQGGHTHRPPADVRPHAGQMSLRRGFPRGVTEQTLLPLCPRLYPSAPSRPTLSASHGLPSPWNPPLVLQTQGLRFSVLLLTLPCPFPWPLHPSGPPAGPHLPRSTFKARRPTQHPLPSKEAALESWHQEHS